MLAAFTLGLARGRRRPPADVVAPSGESFGDIEAQLTSADRLGAVGKAVGGIVHDLNNPLACLSANLECIAFELEQSGITRAQQAEIDELLADCFECMGQIRGILEPVRRFARPQRVDGDVLATLDDAVRAACTIVGAAVTKRAELVVELDDCPPVAADRDELVHVLVNLLDNAVQSLPAARSHEHRITLRSWPEGAAVILEVSDTGCGIAADALAHVFEPFFTTRPGRTSSGLGLSTCRNLVRARGGEIDIASEPGCGATVRLSLPVAAAAALAQEAA